MPYWTRSWQIACMRETEMMRETTVSHNQEHRWLECIRLDLEAWVKLLFTSWRRNQNRLHSQFMRLLEDGGFSFLSSFASYHTHIRTPPYCCCPPLLCCCGAVHTLKDYDVKIDVMSRWKSSINWTVIQQCDTETKASHLSPINDQERR